MSFFTSLMFYRPTPPPRISGPELAEFIEGIGRTGLIERPIVILQATFGRAVDQDDDDDYDEVPDARFPGWSTIVPRDADLDRQPRSIAADAKLLRAHDQPIYRASVGLGCIRPAVTGALQLRCEDGGNGDFNLTLWDVFVQVGPIRLSHIASPTANHVGWVAVSIGGQGSLHPWSPRDLTDRAAAMPALRPLTDLCRATWPVNPRYTPSAQRLLPASLRRRRLRSLRKRLGPLWPHDDLDRPWDWTWGVCETG